MTVNLNPTTISCEAKDPVTGKWESANTNPTLSIVEGGSSVVVTSGLSVFTIDKTAFGLVGEHDGNTVISGIEPSLEFSQGRYLTFTRADNTTYSFTLNGITLSYTSGYLSDALYTTSIGQSSNLMILHISKELSKLVNEHSTLKNQVSADYFGAVSLNALQDGMTVSTVSNLTLGADTGNTNKYTKRLFGTPISTTVGDDWVEQEGWCNQTEKLWYTVRFTFFAGTPFVRISSRVDARFNDNNEGFDYFSFGSFLCRKFTNVKFKVSTSLSQAINKTQINSWSGGNDTYPYVSFETLDGAPYFSYDSSQTVFDQLSHVNTNTGLNSFKYYPTYVGEASISTLINGTISGGRQVRAIVHHSGGSTNIDYNMTTGIHSLGTYNLDSNSYIEIVDISTAALDSIVCGPLTITPTVGSLFTINVKNRINDFIVTSPTACFAHLDLWESWPCKAEYLGSGEYESVILDGFKRSLWGGSGISTDIALSVNGSHTRMLKYCKAPVLNCNFPSYWPEMDGNTIPNSAFDAMVSQTPAYISAFLDKHDSHGYPFIGGDYLDTGSYVTSIGEKTYQSQNLQNDLSTGYMIHYLRNPSQAMWDQVRRSMRYQMDTAFASKWYPFSGASDGKRCCAIGRKGDQSKQGIGTGEPITEFGYAFRSFLLWYELTGEKYALEFARMSMDACAYIYYQQPGWVNSAASDRSAGWALRGLYYGHITFDTGGVYATGSNYGTKYMCGDTVSPNVMPLHTSYYDTAVLILQGDGGSILGLLDHIEASENYPGTSTLKPANSFPGAQPVWAGQCIEALCLWHSILPAGTLKTRVGNAVINCMHWISQNAWRTLDGGLTYQVLYYIPTDEWNNYHHAWLWVSAAQYAYEIAPEGTIKNELLTFKTQVYNYMLGKFTASSVWRDLKYWTAPITYANYYIARA